MPSISKNAELHMKPGPSGGDTAVFICMALVVAALVVGLHRQLGLPLVASAVVGIILFLGLLGVEFWRRGVAERALLNGELRRLETELVQGRAQPQPDKLRGVAVALQNQGEGPAFGAPVDVRDGAQRQINHDQVDTFPSRAEAPRFEAYAGAPAVAQGESLTDYWQETGAAETLAREFATVVPDRPVYSPEPVAVIPEVTTTGIPSSVREDDVEMLQRRIKDMLYQVTAAEQARDFIAAQATGAVTAQTAEPIDAAGVDASLDALNAAVKSMRKTSGGVAASASVGSEPEVGPTGDIDPRAIAIREAVAAGRVDVFLEPILGLRNQAAQHYEVSIRLRGPATEDLGTGHADDVLRGQGLLPLFDTVRIERSAVVAERLAGRGKTGAVFSHASGESLIEPEFTRSMQMDFVARPATARQLILSFSQADVRSFRAAEQRAVSALSALGFRFAISGLTDLDMNFAAMANAGFCFVKLDATVLVEGLPHPGGVIPANDVCRFLADQGFGLIVEGIDSEETLAKVFGFGVLMGQGTLFGGRRPVKADVAVKQEHAAA